LTRKAIPRHPDSEPKARSHSRARTLVDWAVLVGVILFLTQTAPGAVVRGYLQTAVLWTGLFRPDVESPDITLPRAQLDVPVAHLDGTSASLEPLSGKVIFLNVWASWCAPCMAELPFIERLYNDIADDRIAFAMLSVDDSREAAARLIAGRGYTFPVYFLDGPLPAPYSRAVVPTTYVIDPDGRLAMIHTGMANYDSDRFRAFLVDLASTAADRP